MFEFAGKVAVITGAASGFGLAFAQNGAALGMKLVLADLNPDALAPPPPRAPRAPPPARPRPAAPPLTDDKALHEQTLRQYQRRVHERNRMAVVARNVSAEGDPA